MKIAAFFLAASLFMSAPLVKKAEKISDYAQETMHLMQQHAAGRVKGDAVDKAFIKIINIEVPEELYPYKLLVLRLLFQYEFALEIQDADPYTATVLLRYLTNKIAVYKVLLDAYIKGTQDATK